MTIKTFSKEAIIVQIMSVTVQTLTLNDLLKTVKKENRPINTLEIIYNNNK